jgi:hypothetical protein
MYKIVWEVSISTVHLKEKCLSSVIIGNVFKKFVRMCVNVDVDVGCLKRKGSCKCSFIRAHDTWVLTSYDGTFWNSVISAN